MGNDSSYMHIQYNFWMQEAAERAEHEIKNSNLWSGESQESDPSVESSFVKPIWRQAVVILCFFFFSLTWSLLPDPPEE